MAEAASKARVAKKKGAGKRPSKLKQWSDESMREALQAVREGKFGINWNIQYLELP